MFDLPPVYFFSRLLSPQVTIWRKVRCAMRQINFLPPPSGPFCSVRPFVRVRDWPVRPRFAIWRRAHKNTKDLPSRRRKRAFRRWVIYFLLTPASGVWIDRRKKSSVWKPTRNIFTTSKKNDNLEIPLHSPKTSPPFSRRRPRGLPGGERSALISI